MIKKKIGIIGCGNMGEALFSRLADTLEKSTDLMVSEMDPKRREDLQKKYKIIVQTDNSYLVKYSDVIVLAVKPKDFENLLKEEICCAISPDKMIISIAAGVTISHIEKIVGKDVPVIRVMPNMPAIIGRAVSSISAGTAAAEADMALAKEIFSTIGDVVEVEEKLVDAVTAVSGSGPAYFFYLVEALTEAAVEMGLGQEVAKKLVIKTALGSSMLLEMSKDDAAALRARVTSKGGTTEAALKVFKSKDLFGVIKEAVLAAKNRAMEISGGK